MNAVKMKTILPLILILGCLLSLTACDGGVILEGKILDEQGNPIKGATVVLTSRGKRDESVSRDDGSYNVSVIHAPVNPIGTLTVTKEGYQTYQQQFHSREEIGRRKDIVLKALAPVPLESN